MKATPTDKLVYEYMFPKPRPSDPSNFAAFLTRCLIAEVRSETQAFYGHLDTHEAKYPGLDYNCRTHRMRLSRYSWHRRLFRAFDGLGLTPSEISNLTRWEGTKWAKEKYEHEHGVTILDTTDDGMPTWDDDLGCAVYPEGKGEPVMEDDEQDEIMNNSQQQQDQPNEDDDEEDEEDQDEEKDEEDEEDPSLHSVGLELNARLRAGAARREAGDPNAVLDEEWESWLKHVIDSGLLRENMSDQSFRQFFESTVVPAGLVPVDIMAAAREGRWADVPDFLHNLLRRTVEAERRGQWRAAAAVAATVEGTRSARRTYSDLRLPVGESSASQMAPGA